MIIYLEVDPNIEGKAFDLNASKCIGGLSTATEGRIVLNAIHSAVLWMHICTAYYMQITY